jgi:hypothetical protein
MNSLDLKQLQRSLNSKLPEERLKAVEDVRQSHATEAIPTLIKTLNGFRLRSGDRKREKMFIIAILETLLDFSESADVEPLKKWLGSYSFSTSAGSFIGSNLFKNQDEEEIQLNIRIIKLLDDLIAKFPQKTRLGTSKPTLFILCIQPPFQNDNKHPGNLRYMLALDEFISTPERVKEHLPAVINLIGREQSRWSSSGFGTSLLAVGLLSLGFGTLLSAVVMTAVEGAAKERQTREASRASTLTVTPEMLEPQTFNGLPAQARQILALRCYVTGFSRIASQHSEVVKEEWSKRSKVLEKAVLGYALALTGDSTPYDSLKRLASERELVVRILAYEGLIALANSGVSEVSLSDQTKGLSDSELIVALSVAYAMLRTQNPEYTSQLVELGTRSDALQREQFIPLIFALAKRGEQEATDRLKIIANQDENKKVRDTAQNYLQQLETPSSSRLVRLDKRAPNAPVASAGSSGLKTIGSAFLGFWGLAFVAVGITEIIGLEPGTGSTMTPATGLFCVFTIIGIFVGIYFREKSWRFLFIWLLGVPLAAAVVVSMFSPR